MQQIAAKLENDARNELHSVLGMLELIGRGPLNDAQSDYLSACKASADRLLRSLQNVTALLQPDTGPRNCAFDLHQLVAEVGGLMESLAGQKGLSLSVEVPSSVPVRVSGDPDRLQDILVRLLDNAVRFTERGHIQLTVTEVQPTSSGIQVRFAISDTGPGIPATVIARLSKPPSEQAEQGLGLPIVGKLLLSMSGDLTVGSREGGGSVVTISLPFGVAAAPASCAEFAAISGSSSALNILVAEDSDDSYYVLEAYLREHSHRLTRAANGARAVELFQAGGYDLVLMDIHMPDMDGYTATRAIRTWETGCARARVPIIVLSSDSPAMQLRNGAQAGCSGYLTKPVTFAALSRVLGRYASRI